MRSYLYHYKKKSGVITPKDQVILMSCLEGLRWRTDSGGLKHAKVIFHLVSLIMYAWMLVFLIMSLLLVCLYSTFIKN